MKNFSILQNVSLFRGLDREALETVCRCLEARERRFCAHEVILRAGQPADRVGVLLEGRAQVIREEISGARTILTELVPGDLFAEAFACASDEQKILPVTVLAVEESGVLLLDYRRLITLSPSACPCHPQLIANMLAVMADKNRMLNRRLGHLSKRSTREKLLSYLYEQAALHGAPSFTIPFSRQELADYLCVERSAMSAVLSRLQTEGALRYDRNHFTLCLDDPAQ